MSILLVAIPVCHKDVDLALSNLDLCIKLDGTTPHHALVCHDNLLTQEKVKEVIEKAKLYFEKVDSFWYMARKPYDAPWPQPQNFAWQNTARHIETNCNDSNVRGWFWWEADALPLRSHWLDVLHQAYLKSHCPFFGHIVEGKGHMNGVAIYPIQISSHVTNALLVKNVSFDRELSFELGRGKSIARGNDYIGHRLKDEGGSEPQDVPKDLIPTIVLFHGAKQSHAPAPVEEPKVPMIEAVKNFIWLKPSPSTDPTTWTTTLKIKIPTLWHVVERHKTDDEDEARRNLQAERSWLDLYQRKQMKPCHLWCYLRSSESIGDPRGLPFLKDVLAGGLTKAKKHDIIVLTNDDTILHSDIRNAILNKLATTGACASFRLNFPKNQCPKLTTEPLQLRLNYNNRTNRIDIGRDLFAFRSAWLRDHWKAIPDFLLGEPEWDLVLGSLMRKMAGIDITKENRLEPCPEVELERGYVLHEQHVREWMSPELENSKGKLWNRTLAEQFYKDNGID